MRAHTLTLANTPTHDRRCIGAPNHDSVVRRTAFDAGETMAGRWSIEINNVRATLY